MSMQIQKQSNSKLKIAIIGLIILVIASLGYIVFAKTNDIWPFPKQAAKSAETTRDINSVDYAGPTDEDTEHSQDAKEKLLNSGDGNVSAPQDNDQANDSSGKKSAVVNISFADIYNNNLEIRAFTPSVIEGNGTCTATVSKQGSPSITKSSQAFIDSSTSICQPIYIPKSQLSNGTWSVDVAYSSKQYQGSSGQMTVEVK